MPKFKVWITLESVVEAESDDDILRMFKDGELDPWNDDWDIKQWDATEVSGADSTPLAPDEHAHEPQL